MFRSVMIINDVGQSITLGLGDPEHTGLLITSIEGLTPVKGNIGTTEISSIDGVHFNGARMSSRNIVFNITFVSYDGTPIEDIRLLSYKVFPVKQKITLAFKTDNLFVYTEGYVESNEPAIFSKQQTTKVSIICPDPFFYSVNSISTVFNGVSETFEFPFENEGSNKALEMGIIQNYTESNVYYEGDDNIGITIYINAIGSFNNLAIHNTMTRDFIKIDSEKLEKIIGGPIEKGDEIEICTVKGRKYARVLKQGVYYNILNAITRDSSWIQLSKGDNLIAYIADTGIENIQFRIVHENIYEGI